MFMKKKRTGNIKVCACADGRPQRKTVKTGAVSAPKVQTESVLITACINATEICNVVIVDVPGAFMKAHMEEEVHMILDV